MKNAANILKKNDKIKPKMATKILTEHGLRKRIMQTLGASQPTIRLALKGDDSSTQKRQIRTFALQNGGIELKQLTIDNER